MDKPQVYRSNFGIAMGWTWTALAVFFLGDIVLRGRDLASLVAASVLLVIIGISYVVGMRPRIVGDDEGIRLHNPLRDIRVPWNAVEKIDVTDAVRVHSAGTAYRAWVLQTSPRARARARQQVRPDRDKVSAAVADELRGRTPADFAVEQLNRLADSRRTGAEPGPGAGGGDGPRDGRGAGHDGARDDPQDTARDGDTGKTGGGAETGGDREADGGAAAAVTWHRPAVAAVAVPALLCAVSIGLTLLR